MNTTPLTQLKPCKVCRQPSPLTVTTGNGISSIQCTQCGAQTDILPDAEACAAWEAGDVKMMGGTRPDHDTAPACPAEYQGPFFVYDFMPQKIMFKADGSDQQGLDVLNVRGWGHLTGGAALNMPPDVAALTQDNFGKWVAATLNSALQADPDTVTVRREDAEWLVRFLGVCLAVQPHGPKGIYDRLTQALQEKL